MSESIEQDLTPPQNVEIPDQLPLLPVRDIVVFPYMVLPLFVGREMSIKAIEAALAGNRMIFLATQKALDVENPTPDDIHSIGTVGIIMRMLKLPDERIKILVQGLSKAKISGYIQTEPYYSVRIDKITEAKAAELHSRDRSRHAYGQRTDRTDRQPGEGADSRRDGRH